MSYSVYATRKGKQTGWGGAWLGNLGDVCGDLGQVEKAIEYQEDVLVIARRLGLCMVNGHGS